LAALKNYRSLGDDMMLPNDLIFRLRKRAEIRRQITTRKSVQNNEPDRIADLLEEAASEIEALQEEVKKYEKHIAVRYLEELRDEQ
jgi:phage host-nuclease inhibitor protein Gam